SLVGDPRSLICAAIGYRRPAVVSSGTDDIHFVAAVGAVLVLPDFTGFWMHKQSKLVAMSERIDLRLVAGLSDERVIGRHGAVVAETNDFSAVERRVLAVLIALAGDGGAADAHVDHSIAAEYHAR